MDDEAAPDGKGFLAKGGEMGALMRAFDWAATPLGPPGAWPQTLRTAVRLLLNSRHPMFIWWGPELTQFYNDAYRQTMGPERHPSALGQAGRECWAEIWDTIGPQIEFVLAGRGATWHEDQLVPVTRHGRREDVWWTYGYSPIDDDTRPGGVGGVLVVCKDVTEEHLTREALRAGEARWRAVFENMHEGFALCEIVHGPGGAAADFRYLEVNAAWERLTGLPPAAIIGRLASEAIPGLERFWTDTYTRVAETGEPVHCEYQVAALGRWFEVFAYRTEPGRFAALFLNVTERKVAEERQALLMREVDHRAKNALAVVQAALRLTKASDVPTYMRAIEGRVGALARAQAVLAEDRWAGADLRVLLRGELAAFLDDNGMGGPRAGLEGPVVALPTGAAQPLAMAVHELATNAVKYGALSTPAGRVSVSWRLDGGPAGTLRLRWAEAGGPPVTGPPGRRGFGSRVLDSTVRGQLGGTVSLAWEAAGLVCDIEVPLGDAAAAGLLGEG
ncbi:sensor histidine kinase [Siccirubricoccus sp. G192]|uniref:sensor histidine kinase n=1 Tax=Siccirubricoccus sp. G192 TaxID=2849651 RepID=UPI001C2C3C5A|nr:HWE histidine kinase domain-containing protein [Siccirubricoccus sp. G192]MBV1797498.1 PAS domain-containing protein [Siccirubricoccus sp. G192]